MHGLWDLLSLDGFGAAGQPGHNDDGGLAGAAGAGVHRPAHPLGAQPDTAGVDRSVRRELFLSRGESLQDLRSEAGAVSFFSVCLERPGRLPRTR